MQYELIYKCSSEYCVFLLIGRIGFYSVYYPILEKTQYSEEHLAYH